MRFYETFNEIFYNFGLESAVNLSKMDHRRIQAIVWNHNSRQTLWSFVKRCSLHHL